MTADRPRRPWLLLLGLAAVTAAIVVLLLRSEVSGTGAENVGDAGAAVATATATATATTPAPAARAGAPSATRAPRSCGATQSNPGGTNNYIPDAPERDALGEGFEITGTVRSAAGCRPLAGQRVQVWLATETGGEQDNRATVTTDEDGRYTIETDPTIPQFGEPNIHVGHAGQGYEDVFIRRVVDLDDRRATVNLTLAERD